MGKYFELILLLLFFFFLLKFFLFFFSNVLPFVCLFVLVKNVFVFHFHVQIEKGIQIHK